MYFTNSELVISPYETCVQQEK